MLPTINLQLTELTQFDTGQGGFSSEGDAEPTAVFADVLALKGDGQADTGELLPQTGNGLPLLPESLAVDADLTAEIELAAGEIVDGLSEGISPDIEAGIAPTSIVDSPDIIEMSLDVETGDVEIVRPSEVLPIIREISLAVEGGTGKEAQPLTPPAPVDPMNREALTNLRPAAEVPPALLRDAAPDSGEDTPLRPVLAAATPPTGLDPDVAASRIDALERATPVRTSGLDGPSPRVAEPRMPVFTDAVQTSPDGLKPALEPLNLTSQPGLQAGQASVLNPTGPAAGAADLSAEGLLDVRAGGDVTPLARTAAEPLAPRQLQTITQTIATPVQQPDWDRAVSERVVMMANNKLQTAEIRLTPAELGPLRVQVSVDDGAANVTFQAQHAMTREALEQALPRLRELFAENGLSLGQTSVGHEGAGDGDDARSAQLESSGGESADVLADESEAEELVRTRVESGLVDTFV